MKIARIAAVALLTGACFAAATPASASEPERCPYGSHGVVIGFPDPNNPYYICASEPVG